MFEPNNKKAKKAKTCMQENNYALKQSHKASNSI